MSATPHAAFYLRLLYGGGAERVIVNLMSEFVQRGVKVDLVMNTVAGPYLAEVLPEVRIVDLKAPRLWAGLFPLVNYLRQERPTALLSTLHYTNEIALWAKYLARAPTRVVVSEQNTLSIHAKHRSSDRWSPFLARLFYPWADGIVAASKGVAQDIAQVTGLPHSRIQAIYNPIVTPTLLAKKEISDHPWFAAGEPPVILGAGRLEAQKDFPALIRAFAQVRQIKPARLIILGSGRERQNLQNLARNLSLEQDIAFCGFVPNPYAYMTGAAVFVLSSAWEGFGNVLVEAMALGTPVVATDCPNGPAEILDNGKYGELVPVGDTQAIAQAILRVLSGKFKLVDSDWLNQFSVKTVAQNYLEVLGISELIAK